MVEKPPKIIQFPDQKKPISVGKAVLDILSKPQEMQTVQDTLDALTPRYFEELDATIAANKSKYSSPFFVVILKKKEPWALNVLRQWYIARQSKPLAKVLRRDYANFTHDVWEANEKGDRKLLWTLPTAIEATTILKNKQLYHEDLVKWCQQFESGGLP